MQVIENSKVKETLYLEKLDNGLTVMIIPKKGMKKKYMIWGTNYGSNENVFIVPGENTKTEVPNGVAHFLEHKLFEQENGTNSLDTLTALGVDANAFTTNDTTAYLFACTDNFYPAMDELMDYVQNPYFTDENVEKEKGIIGQEIMMYDDSPDWKVYLNAMQILYHNHPVKIDVVGTIDSISKIDKEVLYKCYHTFYNLSNMAIVVCGDFEPENMLEEIKKRLKDSKANGEIQTFYPEEPDTIVKEKIEQKMEVSRPMYTIGIKVKPTDNPEEMVKRDIAIRILLELLLGKSSKLYKQLYDEGIISGGIGASYEFSENYAHILISGQSNDPEQVYSRIKQEIDRQKQEGISENDFDRIKKKLYGEYVTEYDDVENIANMFLTNYFMGINSFDYLNQIDTIDVKYLTQVLNDVFKEEKMVISIVKN